MRVSVRSNASTQHKSLTGRLLVLSSHRARHLRTLRDKKENYATLVMILKGHQIVPYRPADVFSFSFQSNLISWFGETFSSCPDSKQPLRHLWANFHCGNCTVLGSLGQNRPCALLLNLSPAGVEALSPGTAGKYRQVCVWLLGEGVKKKNGGRMGGVDMCRGWWWRGWGCLLGSAVLFFFFYKQPWQRLLCSPGHSRLETPSW